MGSKSSSLRGKVAEPQVSYVLHHPVNNGKTIFLIYINLNHRTDRRQLMDLELNRINMGSFERLSAIKKNHGALGCTLSHIECLKRGIQSGADHIWVFEDDFVLTIEPELLHQIIQCVMETNYDVFLPGYCINNKFTAHTVSINHELFKKIREAQCTHSYFVNKNYAPKLLRNFEEGAKKLEITKNESDYAVDQYWKHLQKDDLWITYVHGICSLQRPGFSDIDQKEKLKGTATPQM